MNIIPFLLQIAALVCLIFATFGLFPSSKVSWGWAGMFLWLLSLMVSVLQLHPIQGS
jgi:hypothetical protein